MSCCPLPLQYSPCNREPDRLQERVEKSNYEIREMTLKKSNVRIDRKSFNHEALEEHEGATWLEKHWLRPETRAFLHDLHALHGEETLCTASSVSTFSPMSLSRSFASFVVQNVFSIRLCFQLRDLCNFVWSKQQNVAVALNRNHYRDRLLDHVGYAPYPRTNFSN